MQAIEIPEFPVLRGEKAKRFLCDYVRSLEEKRGGELREEHAAVLIKIAEGLISSIETSAGAEDGDKRGTSFGVGARIKNFFG